MSASVWKLRTRLLDLARPRLMAILNVTPDSFSDGGLYAKPEAAAARAAALAEAGADLLDIGAESTRPGAAPVDVETEWGRLAPVLRALPRDLPIPVSVDTRHAEVARRALDRGVEIINDVAGGRDAGMLEAAARAGCGYVLMHSRGEPAIMMRSAHYSDVVVEVRQELAAARDQALAAGIAADRICLDPGFGFAKNPEQGWQLLERLETLTGLGHPLLVGLSRKRMLRERVGEDPAALLRAGLEAARIVLEKGARILRVHDVVAARNLLQTLQNSAFSLD